jgi:hypothetical protein
VVRRVGVWKERHQQGWGMSGNKRNDISSTEKAEEEGRVQKGCDSSKVTSQEMSIQ